MPEAVTERGTRAAPLPPHERRAALIEATLPLLLRDGPGVTTRAIAEAAGVAEGTIFRVFASKDDLLSATVSAAMDPTQAALRLRAIDPQTPLRERMLAAAEVLSDRLAQIFGLMEAMRLTRPPDPPQHPGGPPRVLHADLLVILRRLLEPDRERLRMSPEEVARRFRLLVFAGTHPRITDNHPLTAEEIVDLLLDGVCTGPRSATTHESGDSAC
jgi:AcrR family transcriptional regulator